MFEDRSPTGSASLRNAEALFAALRRGEARALPRAISLVEDRAPEAEGLLALCGEVLEGRERALRVGITGPAGAGKSTLAEALTRRLRAEGRRVGILAVDPSSPFTGGAILGDRVRFGETGGEAGVFMRSMATRGHLGGLARTTDDVLTVIEMAWVARLDGVEGGGERRGSGQEMSPGRDVLLIETTGVGQGEIEVVRLADLVAVVLVPGMGDSIQSLKAGVLEIASVFVLNKADREGVERLESELEEMLGLGANLLQKENSLLGGMNADLPVLVKTVAIRDEGIGELLAAIDGRAAVLRGRGKLGEKGRRVTGVQFSPATLTHGDGLRITAEDIEGVEIDHIGIAVRSLDGSRAIYDALGLEVAMVEEVAQERVRVAMMVAGASRIELLEPTVEDSAVGRFLARRGEGIHHIALRVRDLEGTVERLKSRSVRLVSETIQRGAGGHRYVFVHPSSANGVLLELVEPVELRRGDELSGEAD